MLTRNNRLLECREHSILSPRNENDGLLRTVRYAYNEETGNVAHITVKDKYVDPNTTPGDPNVYGEYHDLWLIYTPSGTLWQAVWQQWHEPNDPNHFQYKNTGGWRYPLNIHFDRITDAWQFRFDSGRERYFARRFDTVIDPNSDPNDPNSLLPSKWTILSTAWTDYLGEQPYVDYTAAAANNPVEVTRYLAGYGVQQAENLGSPASTTGFQGDMIRSTMLLTDSNNGGAAASPVGAYTAFGEPVTQGSELGTRYEYAGGWGYESGFITLQGANTTLAPVTLQHVGWRWYQPGIGRFVQRDPAALDGGMNVYAYAGGNPVATADPSGMFTDERYWVDPPPPLPPGAKTAAPPDPLFLCLTGGRHSWMDNPRTVRRVKVVLKVPATVIIWVTPHGRVMKIVWRFVTGIGWVQEIVDAW